MLKLQVQNNNQKNNIKFNNKYNKIETKILKEKNEIYKTNHDCLIKDNGNHNNENNNYKNKYLLKNKNLYKE